MSLSFCTVFPPFPTITPPVPLPPPPHPPPPRPAPRSPPPPPPPRARAPPADSPEAASSPVDAPEHGYGDPIIAALAGRRVIRFHQDTFDLPHGAVLLATGGGFNHAFRVGSAIGIQPHPEVTPTLLGSWLAGGDARRLAIDSGTDPDALVEEFWAAEAETQDTAAAVFDAWIDEIL